MLLISKTDILIGTWSGLVAFTGCGNIFPFLVDTFDFCRSFKVKNITTVKIHIGEDVLFNSELHHVIERNWLLEFVNTI